MHLLPDQIPNPFHFLDEYHRRVLDLLMPLLRLVPHEDVDGFGSTEPCWQWTGERRRPDIDPDLLIYFEPEEKLAIGEDYKDDPDLFELKTEPVFDLGLVLTEEERSGWSRGQLQHLHVHPRLVTWCLRKNQWRQPYETFALPRLSSTCLDEDCLQPWHLVQLSVGEEQRRMAYEGARLGVIRRLKAMKARYETSLGRASKYGHPTNAKRGGPRFILGSAEYTRRENWLALYPTKLQKALVTLERRYKPPEGRASGHAFPVPGELFRKRILATADRYLDRTNECWTLHTDLVNPVTKPVVTYHGKTYSLRRGLFVVLTNQPIPKDTEVRRTCATAGCYRPAHQALVKGTNGV
jgi:hypothetical protein